MKSYTPKLTIISALFLIACLTLFIIQQVQIDNLQKQILLLQTNVEEVRVQPAGIVPQDEAQGTSFTQQYDK